MSSDPKLSSRKFSLAVGGVAYSGKDASCCRLNFHYHHGSLKTFEVQPVLMPHMVCAPSSTDVMNSFEYRALERELLSWLKTLNGVLAKAGDELRDSISMSAKYLDRFKLLAAALEKKDAELAKKEEQIRELEYHNACSKDAMDSALASNRFLAKRLSRALCEKTSPPIDHLESTLSPAAVYTDAMSTNAGTSDVQTTAAAAATTPRSAAGVTVQRRFKIVPHPVVRTTNPLTKPYVCAESQTDPSYPELPLPRGDTPSPPDSIFSETGDHSTPLSYPYGF